MVALIVYLVVGLVAQAICIPIATAIRGHKKFHNAMLYMIIATKVLNNTNHEVYHNMNRFKQYLFIVLYNVAWPCKLYDITKYLIPVMDKAYIDELELLTQKEEL